MKRMETEPKPDNVEVEIAPKTEKLFGRSTLINRIDDGDEIGIGGSLLSQTLETKMRVDEERLAPLLADVQHRIDTLPPEQIAPWLEQAKVAVDAATFVKLWSITLALNKVTEENPDRALQRRRQYDLAAEGANPSIDEFLLSNTAECAEMAAFAQVAMQKSGVSSKLVNGSVLLDKNWEYGEEHSYNYIDVDGRPYIYDPANPIPTGWEDDQPRVLPRIMSAPADFLANIRNPSQKCFIECTDVYGNKPVYYGVNDGASVFNVMSSEPTAETSSES